MKINIRGNAVTPERIADALKECEKAYGLKVKSATLYVRFENEHGQIVDPLEDGYEIQREFVYRRAKEIKTPEQPADPAPEPMEPMGDPMPARDMISLWQKRVGRCLAASEMATLVRLAEETKMDEAMFTRFLDMTYARGLKYPMHYFEKLVWNHFHDKK